MLSIDRREVADLFSSGAPVAEETAAVLGGFHAVYSWTGADDPNFAARLRRISAGSVRVWPFRAMRPGEHAVDYYARCAGVIPAASMLAAINCDAAWIADWQHEQVQSRSILVVHPGSGATRKNWLGFADVCRAWQEQHGDSIALLLGPAETEGLDRGTGRHTSNKDDHLNRLLAMNGVQRVGGLSLPQVAALLRGSGRYLGNDSGISHLAAALGVPTVAVFGPSDPRTWAPRGARVAVVHAPRPCALCGPEIFCTHRLPVDRVLERLAAMNRDPVAC
jgi:hypothetical protein